MASGSPCAPCPGLGQQRWRQGGAVVEASDQHSWPFPRVAGRRVYGTSSTESPCWLPRPPANVLGLRACHTPAGLGLWEPGSMGEGRTLTLLGRQGGGRRMCAQWRARLINLGMLRTESSCITVTWLTWMMGVVCTAAVALLACNTHPKSKPLLRTAMAVRP